MSCHFLAFFFFKQKTAYEMRISDWSSDVCSSDLPQVARVLHPALPSCPGHELWARDFNGATGLLSFVLKGKNRAASAALIDGLEQIGRASCRERVCQYV